MRLTHRLDQHEDFNSWKFNVHVVKNHILEVAPLQYNKSHFDHN